MTPIPKAVRAVVSERAGGACERCGRTCDVDLHHRKFRSRGGQHTVQNLVGLCGFGNTTGCHGWAHTVKEAQIDGWSVASWDDEATKPVLRRGVWVLLNESGGFEALEAAF